MEFIIAALIIIVIAYGIFHVTEARRAKRQGFQVLPPVKAVAPMPPVKPTREAKTADFAAAYAGRATTAVPAKTTPAPVSPSRMGSPAPTSYSAPANRSSRSVDTSDNYLTPALIVSTYDDTYSRPSVDTSSSSSYSSDSCSPSRDYSSSSYSSDSSSSYDSGSSSSSSSSCD